MVITCIGVYTYMYASLSLSLALPLCHSLFLNLHLFICCCIIVLGQCHAQSRDLFCTYTYTCCVPVSATGMMSL